MVETINVKILESKFVITLMPTPKVLSVSDGVHALLGFTAVEFLTGKILLQSRIHPHDQDIAAVLFSREIKPASGIFNIRLRHADGRILCVKGQYAKRKSLTGNDITLELLLQDAKSLWQQQGDQTMMANFKAMMDNTDDYIYFKDRNHVFTGASETLVAITDPSEHWTDLIGKTDYDVFPERFADIYYSLEKQVFAGGHIEREEQETLDNTGSKGWVDNRKYPIKNDNGEIIGLFGIARDITERKRVEYALRENEERLVLATFHNGIGIWDFNLLTQELVLDDLTLSLYNKKREEFNNSVDTWMEWLHPDDLASSYQNIQNAISGKVPFNHAFRVIWTNGEIHHIQSRAKIFLDDAGNPIRMLGTNVDITERKQAEYQTNLINERSQHLLKLESFSEQMTELEFMQHGQELAENITGSQIAFIHFVNEDEETIELVTWSRRTIEHYCHAAFDKHYPVSQAGIWADALRNKHPVMFNDYASYPHKHGLPEGHSPLQRLISVPVIENGKVVMLTGVGNKETDYTETDIESVQLISNDIWRLIQRRRTERDQFIAATVFESQEGMLITDSNNIILRVNHAFTKITGYTADDAIGQTPRLLKSGRQDNEFYDAMWKKINSTGTWEGEIWNRRKSGEIYPEQLTITAVKNEDGTVTNYVATLIDITLNKAAAEAIKTFAFYDPLTQLPNRRLLVDRLTHTMAASKRNSAYGALMFLDLDNFKPLNDTHGHVVGDLLLIEAANRLTGCIREADTVARFGGDEFVVMLAELDADKTAAISQAANIAEKIRAVLSEPYIFSITHDTEPNLTVEHRCTASIGVVMFINHETSQDDLMKLADAAMYEAKDAGRNQIRFYGEQV